MDEYDAKSKYFRISLVRSWGLEKIFFSYKFNLFFNIVNEKHVTRHFRQRWFNGISLNKLKMLVFGKVCGWKWF